MRERAKEESRRTEREREREGESECERRGEETRRRKEVLFSEGLRPPPAEREARGRNERCKVIKANVHHLVGDLKARNFL